MSSASLANEVKSEYRFPLIILAGMSDRGPILGYNKAFLPLYYNEGKPVTSLEQLLDAAMNSPYIDKDNIVVICPDPGSLICQKNGTDYAKARRKELDSLDEMLNRKGITAQKVFDTGKLITNIASGASALEKSLLEADEENPQNSGNKGKQHRLHKKPIMVLSSDGPFVDAATINFVAERCREGIEHDDACLYWPVIPLKSVLPGNPDKSGGNAFVTGFMHQEPYILSQMFSLRYWASPNYLQKIAEDLCEAKSFDQESRKKLWRMGVIGLAKIPRYLRIFPRAVLTILLLHQYNKFYRHEEELSPFAGKLLNSELIQRMLRLEKVNGVAGAGLDPHRKDTYIGHIAWWFRPFDWAQKCRVIFRPIDQVHYNHGPLGLRLGWDIDTEQDYCRILESIHDGTAPQMQIPYDRQRHTIAQYTNL